MGGFWSLQMLNAFESCRWWDDRNREKTRCQHWICRLLLRFQPQAMSADGPVWRCYNSDDRFEHYAMEKMPQTLNGWNTYLHWHLKPLQTDQCTRPRLWGIPKFYLFWCSRYWECKCESRCFAVFRFSRFPAYLVAPWALYGSLFSLLVTANFCSLCSWDSFCNKRSTHWRGWHGHLFYI